MAAGKKKPAKGAPSKGAPPAVPVDRLVDDVVEHMRKDIGGDNVQLLGSDGNLLKIKGVISTQCPTLDAAIGRGGVPLGRLSVLHGAEGSGKTTLALQIVAQCQRMGGLAVYFDKEYKLDPEYAKTLGVDLDKVIISQPPTLETVIDGTKSLIAKMREVRLATGKTRPVLVVYDSIDAMKAKAVLEGEAGDHHIAPQARLWSQHLPPIVESASQESVALLGISQVRKKINVMFGDGDDMAGGQAVRFYASLIMKVVRTGTEKEDNIKVANKIEVECKKNQIAPPFKKALFQIRYGTGVDFEHALLVACMNLDIVTKKGANLYHEGERIGEGIQKAADALRDNDEWRVKLNKEFRKASGW